MFENINELSVLVAAIIASALGSIWYSPLLFGGMWMKSIGLTLEQGEMPKNEILLATIQGVIAQIVFFFVIAQYIAIQRGGAIMLSTLWVSLVVLLSVSTVQSVIWEKRSSSYFFIQTGYNAIIVLTGILIIAFWPW